MSNSPSPRRTRITAAGGLLGASTIFALVLGVGPAPSVLQPAGASRDDVANDISGNCDEAEHASDPACADTPTTVGSTSSTIDDNTTGETKTTTDDGVPADEIRTIDAAGAGTVVIAVEGGSLRLVTATPVPGWQVEVEQSAGQEVELDFRSGTQRVQVNVEIEDGQVRERVRVRDDADGTDVRTEDGVVEDDNSGPGSGAEVNDDNSNSGPDSGDATAGDDHSGSGHDGSDDSSDDSSGSGHGSDD